MTNKPAIQAADIANPKRGFYLVRFAKNGVQVPVEIVGEGEAFGVWIVDKAYAPTPQLVERINLFGEEITENMHRFYVGRFRWCAKYAPDRPEANFYKSIDLNEIPPIY